MFGLKMYNYKDLYKNLEKFCENFKDKSQADIFYKCFFNTLETTVQPQSDGSVFVITGDIPAMWLRDSAAQVMHYLFFAEDKDVRELIKGVLKRQFQMIVIDPYANAFMKDENQKSEWDGMVKTDYLHKIVWERKFEVDSLCYPLFLAYKYYKATSDASVFDDLFLRAFDIAFNTFIAERAHSKKSTYFFYRKVGDSVEDVGKSDANGEKGLIWSGFRPSDDACKFNYHIPDNMFAVSVLIKCEEIFKSVLFDTCRADMCAKTAKELSVLIDKYGIKHIDGVGNIYVSETDCIGNFNTDDDANIPSLLGLTYIEYPYLNKEIYENTRRFVLSERNAYYYQGEFLSGIGSPHTPKNRVWPLAVAMQGITSENVDEIRKCYNMLINTTDGTGYMHEGIDKDNPSEYSRPWFAWANSLFAYFVLLKQEIIFNQGETR